MNDDDIDRRLSANARRWNDEREQGVPLEFALSRLPDFHQRQRGRHSVLLSLLAIVAVIAAAVIALVVLSVLSDGGSGSGEPMPTGTTSVPAANQ
ncbi:MAG: hypothetical protein JWN20_2123 [Jatrophihabitantaceae bacterium]|nr:hypothetical protein [Jatrophihabitantaceae bacterium]